MQKEREEKLKKTLSSWLLFGSFEREMVFLVTRIGDMKLEFGRQLPMYTWLNESFSSCLI